MNRMQAEGQAAERNKLDKSSCYVAELVAGNTWEVHRYPRQKKPQK